MNKKEFDILRSRYPQCYQYVSNGLLEGPSWKGIKGLYFLSNNKVIEETPYRDFRDNLQVLIFEEGIEEIKDDAFKEHRCEHVVLPSTLKYCGKGAFESNELLSFETPLCCFKHYVPYGMREFHFIGDSVVCKATNEHGMHVYIKTKDFDYELFDMFPELHSVHVSWSDASILASKSVMPRFIDRIYVTSKSKNFYLTTDYLKDKSGNIYFVKKRKVVKIGPWYNIANQLPMMDYVHGKAIRFDISTNPNFISNPKNKIIKNVDGVIVYIPDEREVSLTSCSVIAPNALMCHQNIENLTIINYDLDMFDVGLFTIALAQFDDYCENNQPIDVHRRNKPLIVTVPTDIRFKSVPMWFALSKNVNVIVKNVDEPDVIVE